MATVESGRPSPLETPFSRRSLLKGAVGLGAGLLLSDSQGFAQESRFEQEQSEPAFLTKLKQKEHELGNRQLTVEDANETLSHLSDMYVHTHKPQRTAKMFTDATYIVQQVAQSMEDDLGGKSVTLEDGVEVNSKTLYSLKETYPDIYLHSAFADKIVESSVSPGGPSGSTNRSGMYLYLNHINTPSFPMPVVEDTPLLQFGGIDHETSCERSTPATRFRLAALHEDAHFDVERWRQDGAIYGFNVSSLGEQPQFVEELFADYAAASTSDRYGLVFATGYENEPHDFKNFRTILQTVGITDEMLMTFHRNSGLLEFYLLLASSSEIKPTSEGNLINQSFQLMDLMWTGERFHPDWTELKKHFPEIDDTEVDYFDPQSKYIQWRPSTGCLPPTSR